MQRISTLILALSAAMTIQTTQAHMFWLEKTSDQQTRAYFGEYSESLTETQAGPLKAFASAKRFLPFAPFVPLTQKLTVAFDTPVSLLMSVALRLSAFMREVTRSLKSIFRILNISLFR